MARTLEDCGCEVRIHTVPGHGPDDLIVERGTKEEILASLSSVDAVIDGMGIAGEDSIMRPETWLSHKASMELIRRVWGYIRSGTGGSWKDWRD